MVVVPEVAVTDVVVTVVSVTVVFVAVVDVTVVVVGHVPHISRHVPRKYFASTSFGLQSAMPYTAPQISGSASPAQLPRLYCCVDSVFVVVVAVVVVVTVVTVELVTVVTVEVVAVVGHPWSTFAPACTLAIVASNSPSTSSQSVFNTVMNPSRHEKKRPVNSFSLSAASGQPAPANHIWCVADSRLHSILVLRSM